MCDDDELQEAYENGYRDAVKDLKPNYNSWHGTLIQKLYQMRDGWGKHAYNRYLSKEEIDEILNLIQQ